MDTGELLTRWTVRVAMALFVLALLLRWNAAGRRLWLRQARLAWSFGCAAYLLHVACAFQYFHHWSNALAHAATARQTADVVGWNWGGGLYVNYFFTVLWVADMIWWWRGLDRYEMRSRWITTLVHAFMIFIAFNATVVFAHGPVRWIGLAASLLLLGSLIAPAVRKVDSPQNS